MRIDRHVICSFFFWCRGLETHLKFSIRARRQRKLRISLPRLNNFNLNLILTCNKYSQSLMKSFYQTFGSDQNPNKTKIPKSFYLNGHTHGICYRDSKLRTTYGWISGEAAEGAIPSPTPSPPPPPKMNCGFLIQSLFCKKRLCGLLVLR